ncbi:unnamed protein product [Rhizophagus irregularis]|nr:unnamed protein product [Rhizophagus irregularis]
MLKVPLLTRDQNTYNKIGLLVRTDYELSYKSRKTNRSWYFLEVEDFEEFIKEYYRLTSSNKVLFITVVIQKKKRNGEKKKETFNIR